MLERHAIGRIDIEQLLGHRRQPQALFDDIDRDEESGRDVFLTESLIEQFLEATKLIERVERLALHVLRERVLLGRDFARCAFHDAGHRRRLGEALPLHEQFESAIAPPAGRHLEHTGLDAFGVDHRADVEALQESASDYVLGQFLNRDASFDPADVRLGEDELVEGNVPAAAEDDLLGGCWHFHFSATNRPGATLLAPIRHENCSLSFTLLAWRRPRQRPWAGLPRGAASPLAASHMSWRSTPNRGVAFRRARRESGSGREISDTLRF